MQTLQLHKDQSWQEHLVGVSILLAFLLPHTSTVFQLVNPLLCLLLTYRFRRSRKWQPFVFVVLVPIIISILFNFHDASLKAFQSTFTILLYFACFPLVGKVQVRNTYLYICLAYIFVSQIVYLLGIPGLTAFFDRYYPISEDDLSYYGHVQDTINYSNVFNYRLGGLFHNPNQCSRYLTMLMAFFLSINKSKPSRNVIFFILLSFCGIIIAGSRTGFVVSSLIVYLGFIRNNKISGWIRYMVWGIGILGILHILQTGNTLRGLNIEDGLQGSANLKWVTFRYYLRTENNPLAFFFGHMDISLFNGGVGRVMRNFDSEYGELVFRFGFTGMIAIMLFWWLIFKRVTKDHRFFFILLFWIFTSTIVASYRALFIFILLLSVVYSNNPKSNDMLAKRKG